MSAIGAALRAVDAAARGDRSAAPGHLDDARRLARVAARRDRQVVEIAALVVAGHHERAAGLALEHVADFPGDVPLLARIQGTAGRS